MVILLRLIHISFGVFWVGAAVTNSLFLIPAIRAVGPAAGPVMQQIGQKLKMPIYIIIAGFLTVLSGIGLYWHDSAGFTNGFMRSGGGMTFGIGGAIAIVTLVIGVVAVAPAAKRAAAIGAQAAASGKPPSPEQAAEMQRLQARLGKLASFAAVMLALATIAMAVARYIP
jgi:hypothetical protein